MSKKLDELRARTRSSIGKGASLVPAAGTDYANLKTHYQVTDQSPDHVLMHWGGASITNLKLTYQEVLDMIKALGEVEVYLHNKRN